MITKVTRMEPKSYYIIDGIELDANDVLQTLEDITSSHSWLNEYCLPDECPHELAKLGYLEEKLFYYEDVMYRDTEDRKAKALFEELIRM